MVGDHRTDDADDPRRPGSPWWRQQHNAPPGPRHHDPPTQVIPGLPRDEYDRWATGDMPRIPPYLPDAPVSPPIRSEGMPTVDRPRSPAPIGTASVRQPDPAPQPGPHAERPSLGARLTSWLEDNGIALIVAGVLLLIVVIWVTFSAHSARIADLERQNAQLRTEQAGQLQRIADAEQQAADAKTTAAEHDTELEQMRSHIAQLEQQDQTSGS